MREKYIANPRPKVVNRGNEASVGGIGMVKGFFEAGMNINCSKDANIIAVQFAFKLAIYQNGNIFASDIEKVRLITCEAEAGRKRHTPRRKMLAQRMHIGSAI